jgi:hypothetical protein
MRKFFFVALARLNRLILPKISRKDPARLTKLEKAITAYRYWVTVNSLG